MTEHRSSVRERRADGDRGGDAAAQWRRAVPDWRASAELARVDLVRGARWVAAQDFWLLYTGVSMVGLLFGSWMAFGLGREAGAALAAGDSTWLTEAGAWTLWSVVWLFNASLLVVDAVGSNGDAVHDGHYLTIRPVADLAGGKLLAAAGKFAVFVFVPALACYLGVTVGLGTPAPLAGAVAAAAVTVASATAVGYPVGFAVKGAIRRSPALTRLKPVVAAAVGVGYVVVMATGEFVALVERLAPLLRAPPLGWLADLSFATTPGVAAAPGGAAAAVLGGVAVAVGALLAVPAARYAWRADRALPASGEPDETASAPDHAVDRVVGAFARSQATRGVASTALLRAYRAPLQLVFVALPLVAAIPVAERLLATGSLPWYAPWLAVWYGAWAAGATLPLNPLGDQGAALPALLTAPADGRSVVHGYVPAAALPAAPATAGVAVTLGHVAGRPAAELPVLAVAGLAAVVAAAVLAAGVGTVFPRFEAVDFAGARQAVPPSKVAYSAFSTVLSLAVAAAAVLLDDLAADVGALLLSRWLPFGLVVDAGALTAVAWVLGGGVAVSVPLAYLVAVRRVDGYRVS